MTWSLTRRAALLGASLVCLAWFALEVTALTRGAFDRLALTSDAHATVEALAARRAALQVATEARIQDEARHIVLTANGNQEAWQQLQAGLEVSFPDARQQRMGPDAPDARQVSGRMIWVGSEAEFRAGLERTASTHAGLRITTMRIRPVRTDQQDGELELTLEYTADWESAQS